jgi:hypothetical protein
MLVVIGLIVRSSPSVFLMMWNDRDPGSRVASRIAIGSIGAFLLWTTVFDNWRQLLGYLVNEKQRWRSDPYLNDPPADAVRAVTFILFGCAVLAGAYLYARYARGYWVPVVVTPLALTTFYALNGFRMRFELVGPLSERGVDWSDILGAAATLFWFGVFYCVLVVLIASAYALFWGPTSIVVALLYRSTIGRQRIEEPEMYRILRERSMARSQGPAPKR